MDKDGSGYRVAGPKAWGNPYNKPTASFIVNADELIKYINENSWDKENEMEK